LRDRCRNLGDRVGPQNVLNRYQNKTSRYENQQGNAINLFWENNTSCSCNRFDFFIYHFHDLVLWFV